MWLFRRRVLNVQKKPFANNRLEYVIETLMAERKKHAPYMALTLYNDVLFFRDLEKYTPNDTCCDYGDIFILYDTDRKNHKKDKIFKDQKKCLEYLLSK